MCSYNSVLPNNKTDFNFIKNYFIGLYMFTLCEYKWLETTRVVYGYLNLIKNVLVYYWEK